MRISGIDVERFGVWSNYDQTLSPQGLTVLHGPNGTGKTTLLKFIRGVLFGFSGEEQTQSDRWRIAAQDRRGTLHLEQNGQSYVVQRVGRGNETGQLILDGREIVEAEDARWKSLLAGIDGKLFQSIFAVGLQDMQQLATLADGDVATHIYQMTLSPEGRLLQDCETSVARAKRTFFSQGKESGQFDRCWAKRDEFEKLRDANRSRYQRYRTLRKQQSVLQQRVEQLQERESSLQSNLHGAQHVERLWGPWRQIRDARRELTNYRDLRELPEDALNRFDAMEATWTAVASKRTELESRIQRHEAETAQQDRQQGLLRYAPAIRVLLQQRQHFRSHEQKLDEWNRNAAVRQRDFTQMLTALGPRWNAERLDRIDDSPEAQARFFEASREFDAAFQTTRQRQHKYRQRANRCRDRELSLKAELMELGFNSETIEEPLVFARNRLDQLVQLGQWQVQAAELNQRNAGLDGQLDRMRIERHLPSWVWWLFLIFLVCGAGFVAAGLQAGVTVGALIGAIYVALGLAAAGIGWGFKLHYDRDAERQVFSLREQRRENQTRLHALEDRIRQLVDAHGLKGKKGYPEWLTLQPDGKLLTQAARRLADLERLQRDFSKIKRMRRQLSETRETLQNKQRDFSHARKEWCRVLTQLGLDETTNPKDALKQWQQLHQLRTLRNGSSHSEIGCQQCQSSVASFTDSIRQLADRMQRPISAQMSPWVALNGWEQELRSAFVQRRNRRKSLTQLSEAREEFSRWQRQHSQTERDRNALLDPTGARDRDGLVKYLGRWQKRRDLEQQVAKGEAELQRFQSEFPEIALTEDVLEQFDPRTHQQSRAAWQQELAKVEPDLRAALVELGGVQQELRSLETDLSATRLRWEQSRNAYDLKRTTEDWLALHLSDLVLDDLRDRHERSNQPELLAAASPYLQRLTLGRYVKIWTPLGKQSLCVDDDRQQAWPVELLSGGTREQLFLALRLALVEQFGKMGVDLPMILDDVTVNFDHEREEAAVETLMEFAKTGRQVLFFTSHAFLCDLFEKRDVPLIQLPQRRSDSVLVRERRAG